MEETVDGVTNIIYINEEGEPVSGAQITLNSFWPSVMDDIRRIKLVDAKNQQLPLARIKKIMKLDDEVKMISAEAPLLFAKAAEIFIHELTLMAWVFTEENKRRTLQRSDIAMAISKYDQFDFLIDIVPREEIKNLKKETMVTNTSPNSAGTSQQQSTEQQKSDSNSQIQCYLQLAQQQRQTLQSSSGVESSSTVVSQTTPASSQNQLGTVTGNIVTSGGTTIPLTTLLHQQQQQNHHHHQALTAASPQQQQGHQILNTGGTIAFSNGQNIILTTSPTQQQQQQVLTTATGQLISGLTQQAQPSQQQFHVIQQIITPTGEVQHIQIPISANQLGMLRMQSAATTQPQIVFQNMPQGQFLQMSSAPATVQQAQVCSPNANNSSKI